jgi:hypothetical protein
MKPKLQKRQQTNKQGKKNIRKNEANWINQTYDYNKNQIYEHQVRHHRKVALELFGHKKFVENTSQTQESRTQQSKK